MQLDLRSTVHLPLHDTAVQHLTARPDVYIKAKEVHEMSRSLFDIWGLGARGYRW